MDRTAAVIVLLGIFLGSVYSITSQTGDVRIFPLPNYENDDQAMVRSDSLLEDASDYGTPTPPESKTAPTQDDSHLEFDYVTETVSGGGLNAEGANDQTFSWDPDIGEVAQINVGSGGVIATYPEVEKRYFYADFVTAVIVLSGNSTSRGIAEELGAVIADEFSSGRVLIFLPGGSEAALQSLVEEGRISSYELGGWGTGFGKI